jgi:hypothetical protein
MKKITIILAVLLCLASLMSLTGCSGYDEEMHFFNADNNSAPANAFSFSGYTDSAEMEAYDTLHSGEEYDYWTDDDYDYEDGETVNPTSTSSSGSGVSDTQVSGATVVERKVIRNANLTLEVLDEKGENEEDGEQKQAASELYALLVEQCNSLGGHEFSSEMSKTHHMVNVTASVKATLKLPPEKLDEFIKFVNENARVTHSKVDSDDVTNTYYDLQTRLETKRKSLESYYKLLENADELSEIVSLQRTIDGIIEEIESVEGRLKVMDSQINMATVRLEIRQVIELEEEEEPRREVDWGALSLDDMGYLIQVGFISVVNFILSVVQGIAIALIVASPIWIPIAIFIFVLAKRHKKKKKKKD